LGVDNQPYGQAFEKMDELVYDNFAYKHSVIGSMADLDAASVEDVQQFFKTYYAPNNAVLALAGDLDAKDTLARVKKYFGAVPRQPSPKPVDLTEPEKAQERRAKIDDKLARVTRLDIAYRIPDITTPDARALAVGGMVVGGGESSRLYQALVKDKEVAASVFAGVNGYSVLNITHVLRSDPWLGERKEIEIPRYLHISDRKNPPRLNTAISLADDATLYNDPNRINTESDKRLAVTAADIQKAAQAYLKASNRVVVTTVPAVPPKPAAK